MVKSLTYHVKDEPAVNNDFSTHGCLPSLEKSIEDTRGNHVLSFVPGRFPDVYNPHPNPPKLSHKVVTYLQRLVEQHHLEIGQLGIYHYCPKCAQPERDTHSHEPFLRHGGKGQEYADFKADLIQKRTDLKVIFGNYPLAFTSPQNWFQKENSGLNFRALAEVADNFDIMFLTHPSRKKIGLLLLSHINGPSELDYAGHKINIIPTLPIDQVNDETLEKTTGFYIHHDETLGDKGEKARQRIKLIGSQVFRPHHIPCKKINPRDLEKDVQLTGRARRFKERFLDN